MENTVNQHRKEWKHHNERKNTAQEYLREAQEQADKADESFEQVYND